MRQRGENPKYPEEIVYWRVGMKVPEWLSDQARVKFIDGEGNITLEKRDRVEGGYEILGSDGISILVRTKGMGDYICFDGRSRIFSLTEKQMELLYKEC